MQNLVPGIEAGKTYRVTWCHRFAQMSPERPPYVRFRLCAFVDQAMAGRAAIDHFEADPIESQR